jgi:hypothetical protein
VLYGEERQLSSRFLKLRDQHHLPVFIGQEFWHRLTGQKTFYAELTQAFSEVADEVDGTDTLKQLTKRLAKEIAKRDGV